MAPTIKCPSSLALHRLCFMCVAQVKLQTERERTREDRDREPEGSKNCKKQRRDGGATTFGWSELFQCAVGSLAQLSEL